MSAMQEAETVRPLVTWEAEGRLYYVEMGNVPQKLYDELELERFDVQVQAMKHHLANKKRDDEEEDE